MSPRCANAVMVATCHLSGFVIFHVVFFCVATSPHPNGFVGIFQGRVLMFSSGRSTLIYVHTTQYMCNARCLGQNKYTQNGLHEDYSRQTLLLIFSSKAQARSGLDESYDLFLRSSKVPSVSGFHNRQRRAARPPRDCCCRHLNHRYVPCPRSFVIPSRGTLAKTGLSPPMPTARRYAVSSRNLEHLDVDYYLAVT